MSFDVGVMQLFIDTLVGIPKFSYPARQNDAPRPKDEFAHIRLLEEYQIGIPSAYTKENPNGSTTETTVSPVRLRFRIGVVETDGVAASKIMHRWTTEEIKELMVETGFGFVSCHPLSNEDAQLEKEWEIRDGFSVEMYATRVYQTNTDFGSFINGLLIKGKFVEHSQNTILLEYDINND